MKEGDEAVPTLEHVINRLGNRGAARQLAPFSPQPFFKTFGKGDAVPAPPLQAFAGSEPVDLALNVEQGIDALDRLQRNR